ncbi:MAG: STAS domain-containing protein [Sedimentisphaerales bacterium]|nr:STAS domain-containing protein [Sedimentisphaerales bacterium]
MPIQQWSDEIIIVDLPDEVETTKELVSVVEFLADKTNFNVVIDFTGVAQISSAGLLRLLQLRQLTASGGRRLVLCNIDPSTEELFSVTGLNDVFDLTADKFSALATLEMIG